MGDSQQILRKFKERIIIIYRNEFEKISQAAFKNNDDLQSSKHVAIALYFSCYLTLNEYESNQKQYAKYLKHGQFCDLLFRLNQEVKEQSTEIAIIRPKFISDFEYYKNYMIKAELGDRQKLQMLVKVKKLYCIPWLIAG